MGDKKKEDLMILALCLIALFSIFAGLAVSVTMQNRRNELESETVGIYKINKQELLKSGKEPIKTAWKYYEGMHIISDNRDMAQAEKLIYLPMEWNMFDPEGWGGGGKASYKLILENLPDEELILFFNGISSNMKLFVNGEEKFYPGIDAVGNIVYIDHMPMCEITIEVTSKWLSGVYAQPWLFSLKKFNAYYNIENSVRMILFGGFLISALFVVILLRRMQEKKQYYLFLTVFFGIGLFFVFTTIETSGGFKGVYDFISFEETHLLATVVALFLGVSVIRLEQQFYFKRFNEKILYLITTAFFGAVFVKVFIGKFVNMDICVICFAIMFLFYNIYCMCTEFAQTKDYKILCMGIATIFVEFSIFIALVLYYYTLFFSLLLLWVNLLAAVLFYVNVLSLIFAENEDGAKKENEAKQNQVNAEIAFLSSQIQPHFQYNTLTTIQEMCYTDPLKAADAIAIYASFLRRRIDFEKYEKLIPFSEEIISINEYIELQKLRFGDKIKFVTNFEITAFSVPPLSIQTLVENSVHHGLRKTKEGGGTVWIETKRFEDNILIFIIDNGAGFDVNFLPETQGSGLNNSRFRIEQLTGGSVQIISKPGEGTEIQIIIPYKSSTGGG